MTTTCRRIFSRGRGRDISANSANEMQAKDFCVASEAVVAKRESVLAKAARAYTLAKKKSFLDIGEPQNFKLWGELAAVVIARGERVA